MKQPWENEPDRLEGCYRGYRWLIVRVPGLGHLCGYVGIPAGHRLFGVDRDNAAMDFNCHGGITWSSGGDDHRPDNYWWIGFDCGHHGDLSPMAAKFLKPYNEEYRTIQYVEHEIRSLIDQIVKRHGKSGDSFAELKSRIDVFRRGGQQ